MIAPNRHQSESLWRSQSWITLHVWRSSLPAPAKLTFCESYSTNPNRVFPQVGSAPRLLVTCIGSSMKLRRRALNIRERSSSFNGFYSRRLYHIRKSLPLEEFLIDERISAILCYACLSITLLLLLARPSHVLYNCSGEIGLPRLSVGVRYSMWQNENSKVEVNFKCPRDEFWLQLSLRVLNRFQPLDGFQEYNSISTENREKIYSVIGCI